MKHYQDGSLVRGRLNDPELDAMLVLEVFENQQRAFRETSPELRTAWHWLTTTDVRRLARSTPPAQNAAGSALRHSLLPGASR